MVWPICLSEFPCHLTHIVKLEYWHGENNVWSRVFFEYNVITKLLNKQTFRVFDHTADILEKF